MLHNQATHVDRSVVVWAYPIKVVIGAIVLILLAAYLGVAIVAPLLGWGRGIDALSQQSVDVASFEARLARWDSGYYLQIADRGYRLDGPERAFFPLYPLLCGALSIVLGIPLLWSGLVVSVVCFVAATLLLYRWVCEDHDHQIASQAVLWFCFFPVSFYQVAFYPEALYLLSNIAGIYFARRGKYVTSGFWIAIAGATRPVAFCLVIPFVLEFVQQRQFQPARWLRFVAGAALAPLGVFGYFGFLSWQAGGANPIAIYNANLEQNWKMATVWPWETLLAGLQSVAYGTGIGVDWFSRAVVWQDFLYAVFGLALACWSLKHIRLSSSVFFIVSMLFFLTSRGPDGYVFESMPRHVASIVPLYTVLALLTNRLSPRLRWVPLLLSLVLLGLFTAWFASGRWVA